MQKHIYMEYNRQRNGKRKNFIKFSPHGTMAQLNNNGNSLKEAMEKKTTWNWFC